MTNNFNKSVSENIFEVFFNFAPLRLCVFALIFSAISHAQTLAPGAPGKDAHWASAGKQAVGTSASLESKVWFTLAQGAMTEVYYPDVTTANVHILQFVVVNPKTKKVETERDDANHQIKVSRNDSLSFQQINIAKSGAWEIQKSYAIDPARNSILISATFTPRIAGLELYIYYDPSLNNTGMHDTAWTSENSFLASDADKSSALVCKSDSCNFAEMTNGFLGISDGIEQLKRDGKITNQFSRAENGNVVQLARINSKSSANNFDLFQLSLGFGKTPEEALQTANISAQKGFVKNNQEYEKGWSDYVKTLPKVAPKYQTQFDMAAMVLKAQEDKTVRGANVASLTIPWGGGVNANEDVGGGYHLVWSRDLYQVVTAYMALNDTAAANRALDFLFKIQQKPDGSFPQNSWLDGKKGWGSLQLDEVAYPLILAYQLGRNDKETYENHVKKAADFLVKTGPKTVQERWEEKSGYSPSTIAAEIAGLVCAAEIARKNNDETSANLYLKTADDWQSNIEKWTATTNGKYGDGNYYLRLTENGTPDANEKTMLNNGAGTFLESEIVDAGFLELVRLGIKSPDNPLIQKSVKVIDQVLKVNTPNGEGFYRYNHDGYGEMDDGRRWNWDGKYTGRGRLWALLSGERGQYELALANNGKWKMENGKLESKIQNPKSKIQNQEFLTKAKSRLDAMLGFANEGLMIPEQVWDKRDTPQNIDKQYIPELKFGEGTGSATPLAWSMAQFIRLAVNLQAGRNLDTPDVVYNRYVLGKRNESKSYISKPYPYSVRPAPPVENNFIPDKIATTISQPNPAFSNLPVISPLEILNRIAESPQIIGNEAVFTYNGSGKDVQVVGDFTGWKPKELKFVNNQIKLSFAPTARVEYKLIVDGNWITDPLNPNKVDNGVGGENSFFTMPDYKPTAWDKDIPGFQTSLDTIEIQSKVFGDTRKIQIFAPAMSAAEPNRLPVIYFQDGSDYVNRARALQIYQNLSAAKKIKPLIMVFIDPRERVKDYWASDKYAEFMATEVVPAVDAKYKTIQNRDGRALLGASLGGVTSVHTALKYPEIFGRVGGQSSSFWIDDERVIKELTKLDSQKTPLRFYFDTGTLEGAADDRKAVEILRAEGYDVTYEEAAAGHNWTSWRDRLADALVALWK